MLCGEMQEQVIVAVQVAFVGHDTGHNAVAHNSKYDGYIGLLVNACIGIGPSWWKVSHLPIALHCTHCPALPCPALHLPALCIGLATVSKYERSASASKCYSKWKR